MPMNGKSSRGFTLIELLVVIAIISLLVSILIPSLTKAKELAKRVACAANWHDVGIAGAMYISDHHGMPDLVNGEPRCYWRNDATLGAFGLFGPYGNPEWLQHPWDHPKKTSEHGIYSCPAGMEWSDFVGLLNINYILVFTCPGAKAPWEGGDTWPWPTREYDARPADTSVGVCDMMTFLYNPGYAYLPTGHESAGLNVLYLDGHVAWKDTEEFSDCGFHANPWLGFPEAFNP